MTDQDDIQTTPVHVTTVPLRWSDFDRYGHMNNAAYIELAQEARVKFARDEFLGRGLDVPTVFVRRLEIDYLRPVLPDTTAEVVVETVVTQFGRTSFTTRQQIKDHLGNVACVIDCVQVAIDMSTANPREITATERKVLTQAGAEVEGGDAEGGEAEGGE